MIRSKAFRSGLALILFAIFTAQTVIGTVRETSLTPLISASAKPYARKPSREAIKWADQQLKRMSTEEKIGQMISIGVNATFLNRDSEAFKALRHQVVDNHVGDVASGKW